MFQRTVIPAKSLALTHSVLFQDRIETSGKRRPIQRPGMGISSFLQDNVDVLLVWKIPHLSTSTENVLNASVVMTSTNWTRSARVHSIKNGK